MGWVFFDSTSVLQRSAQGPTDRDALLPLGYSVAQGHEVFFSLQPTDSIDTCFCACTFPLLFDYQSAHTVSTDDMLP